MLVIAYGGVKFIDFYQKNDPIVNTDVKHGQFRTSSHGLKLEQKTGRFKIAFAVKKHEEDTYLDNDNYVEWKAMIYEGTHKKHHEREVPIHKCTEADYE